MGEFKRILRGLGWLSIGVGAGLLATVPTILFATFFPATFFWCAVVTGVLIVARMLGGI